MLDGVRPPTSGRSMLEAAATTRDQPALRQRQVGGLLAVEQPQTVGDPLRYVYLYDATLDTPLGRHAQAGNVGQMINPAAPR